MFSHEERARGCRKLLFITRAAGSTRRGDSIQKCVFSIFLERRARVCCCCLQEGTNNLKRSRLLPGTQVCARARPCVAEVSSICVAWAVRGRKGHKDTDRNQSQEHPVNNDVMAGNKVNKQTAGIKGFTNSLMCVSRSSVTPGCSVWDAGLSCFSYCRPARTPRARSD